ncbi:YrdB family protein [Paenibacillus sp. SN-8-1]|uniref:YrdB family protein n=1 Tax=Paenibacillus sp. SN-8-1 TaxID=3435409 RepID=UPI003D9AA84D
MVIIQSLNLVLRFLLELAALAAYGYWGFHTGNHAALKFLLGLGTPIAAAVLWGLFGSPKASYPLGGAAYFVLELVVFGLSAAALYAVGAHKMALILAILLIVNKILMLIWNQ